MSTEELKATLDELYAIRLEAKALARSGHPAARAEGKRSIAVANDRISHIKGLLADVEQ